MILGMRPLMGFHCMHLLTSFCGGQFSVVSPLFDHVWPSLIHVFQPSPPINLLLHPAAQTKRITYNNQPPQQLPTSPFKGPSLLLETPNHTDFPRPAHLHPTGLVAPLELRSTRCHRSRSSESRRCCEPGRSQSSSAASGASSGAVELRGRRSFLRDCLIMPYTNVGNVWFFFVLVKSWKEIE